MKLRGGGRGVALGGTKRQSVRTSVKPRDFARSKRQLSVRETSVRQKNRGVRWRRMEEEVSKRAEDDVNVNRKSGVR